VSPWQIVWAFSSTPDTCSLKGSVCLTGSKADRVACLLDEPAVVAALITAATTQSGGADLLRIYWYDAVGRHPNTVT